MAAAAIEVLKQAIDIRTIPHDRIVKQMFPKAVPENEWHEGVKEFLNNDNDGYTMVETTDGDMRKIEELLEIPKSFFSTPYMIKTKREHCPECQRQNNFLDVVATGLKVHKPKFLVDVFTGKFGHIVNDSQHQRCFCYQCGILLPEDATKFSAPKLPTVEEKAKSNYYFPIYTFRF